jgi:hypothetical protein
MFLQGRAPHRDRLLPPPVDRCGACGLHPGLMRQADLFGCAPPKTAPDFVAGRTWRPERARLARDGLAPVAHHACLTAATAPTRCVSHPLAPMAGWTPRGLELDTPGALGLRDQSGRLGRLDGMRVPRAVEGDRCLGTEGAGDAGHRATVDSYRGSSRLELGHALLQPLRVAQPTAGRVGGHDGLCVDIEAPARRIHDVHPTPPAGCDAARDARFMPHLSCVLPSRGATDGGASEHPGPTVGRLGALASIGLRRAVVKPPA